MIKYSKNQEGSSHELTITITLRIDKKEIEDIDDSEEIMKTWEEVNEKNVEEDKKDEC